MLLDARHDLERPAAGHADAVARPPPLEVPPPSELFLNFESLGDNCELGVIQRQAGLEPLGLLRFSYVPLPSLITALDERFRQAGLPENVEVTLSAGKEFMVNIRGYDFNYHTRRYQGEIKAEALAKEEVLKQKFLARRLLGTLQSGEKILVRRGPASEGLEDIERLLEALRRHGPVTLLWVVEADAQHPARSVELIAPHLIRGRVGKLAPYHDAHSTEFTSWLDICRGAYLLWKSDAPVGAIIPAPVRNDLKTNLLIEESCGLEGAAPAALLTKQNMLIDVVCGGFPLRWLDGPTICRNVLLDRQAMVGVRVEGLVPRRIYTFSVWIRLERGPQLEVCNALFGGCRAERGLRIRLKPPGVWQQLEVTAAASEDGVLGPRVFVKGPVGAAFYLANWRLEPGMVIGDVEPPCRYGAPQAALGDH